MGAKKGGSKARVTDYHLSGLWGLCLGTVDTLREVWIGEKALGIVPMTTQSTQAINKPDLFGGNQKEGGAVGRIDFLPGEPDQQLRAGLAAKFGATPDTAVAYRGLTSLFFTESASTSTSSGGLSGGLPDGFEALLLGAIFGGGGSGSSYQAPTGGGFLFSQNSPYLKPIWADVTKIHKPFEPLIASIERGRASRISAVILLDNSGSMGELVSDGRTRLEVQEEATVSILTGLKRAIQAGAVEADIQVSYWDDDVNSASAFSATGDDIDNLIAFVESPPSEGGTDFSQASSAATTWFAQTSGDTSIQRRVVLFLTDGEPTSGAAAAATQMSDLIDQNSGTYNTTAGTQVDCYAANIGLEDTSATTTFDNSAEDGIPVLDADNQASISSFLLSSLFSSNGIPDMNPVHIILECMTNTEWGMGSPLSRFNLDVWTEAANTIYAEGLGLTMVWHRPSTIEEFVGEVIDHIEGYVFTNPRTGLFEIRLIRADYDEDDLLVLDETNAKIVDLQDKLWTDTTNEIVVTYTDPETHEDATVSVQDPGNISIQGQIVSDGRNYYGVYDRTLAFRLASRDLRAASLPLKTLNLEISRKFWDITPGTPVKVNFPSHDLDNVVFRLGPVDYGISKSASIKASAVEDVFASPDIQTTDTNTPTPVAEADAPQNLDFAEIITLPKYMQDRIVDVALTAAQEYPDAIAGVLAADADSSVYGFDIYGDTTNSVGTTTVGYRARGSLTTHGLLATAIVGEVETVLEVGNLKDVTTANVIAEGDFVVFRNDGDIEWTVIESVTEENLTLRRGVLDTTPKPWPVDTDVWLLPVSHPIADPEIRADTEEVTYQLLTKNSVGTLALADADQITGTLTGRPTLPFRPAAVQIDGEGFDAVQVSGADPVFTWARRNKLTEDNQILRWDDADVTPEDGQTVGIRIYDVNGVEIVDIPDLAGTSYTLDLELLRGNARVLAEVYASLDGLDSLRGHCITMSLDCGYGIGYGFCYGEESTGFSLQGGYGNSYGQLYGQGI